MSRAVNVWMLLMLVAHAEAAKQQPHVVVKEGSAALLHCNVSVQLTDLHWVDPRGAQLATDTGGKWQLADGSALNISVVSFEDRGRYTCVTSGGANFSVTLRVSYTHSGLGVYYVIVCLVAFSVTMLVNATRLCMVSAHLRDTERAINDFFRTEGAEKLHKAFQVAKHIPIVTSARALELAKVTHCKTKELLRHVEELARAVPLPPLILNCGGGGEQERVQVHEVHVKVGEEGDEEEVSLQ